MDYQFNGFTTKFTAKRRIVISGENRPKEVQKMENISTKENGKKSMIIQQAFYDLADKLEQECGDWPEEPVPPELHDKILARVAELEKTN